MLANLPLSYIITIYWIQPCFISVSTGYLSVLVLIGHRPHWPELMQLCEWKNHYLWIILAMFAQKHELHKLYNTRTVILERKKLIKLMNLIFGYNVAWREIYKQFFLGWPFLTRNTASGTRWEKNPQKVQNSSKHILVSCYILCQQSQ